MPSLFIAYPSQPPRVGQTIESAVEQLRQTITIETWKENEIAGRFIGVEVLNKIDTAECLIADITELNFNVTYEIGYAIGKKKRLLLIR